MNATLMFSLVLGPLLSTPDFPAVYTEPGDIPRMVIETEHEDLEVPLHHTAVDVQIVGTIARVEITQRYRNTFNHPIDTVYVFPLPENSAVDAMRIQMGSRVIEAEIRKRREAQQLFKKAKEAGHTAALLEQERPNIFTQSVANIDAQTNIEVVINYLQDLTYDAGRYEFVFPMVVGPRYVGGVPLPRQPHGRGRLADTTSVPDASRITPPIAGRGTRAGHDISLNLVADPAFPIDAWDVPTHLVDGAADSDGALHLSLDESDRIPNRDFVLHFTVAGDEPAATVLIDSTPGRGGERHFSLVVHPPQLDVEHLVGQRELIFVLDVSGSMSGFPLSMCQDAMEYALRRLRPTDTFNVLTFAGTTAQAFARSSPVNDHTLAAARDFITELYAGGGTHMAAGVETALDPDAADPNRRRYVFIMTDGFVGNEEQIVARSGDLVRLLARRGQQARVFGYGVGAAPNRYLIDEVSREGFGVPVYVSTREDPALGVERFFQLIGHPVLEDVRIDWGGATVSELYPARIPDLFASAPVVMHGKVRGPLTRVRVTGQRDEKRVAVDHAVHKRPTTDATLATLWARAKIGELNRDLRHGDPNAKKGIERLGLKHGLVTEFTSLIAVDSAHKVSGRSSVVVVPIEVPEGVDAEMAGAYGMTIRSGILGLRSPTLHGNRVGDSFGTGGLGIGGFGSGGGGYGHGYGHAIGHARKRHRVMLSLAAPVAHGSLGRDAIKRVVNNHRGQIRHCYELQLQQNPQLAGRIVVNFVINPDGGVIRTAIRENTLHNEAVETCIQKVIRRWVFPSPTGAGTVEVNYPFVFRLDPKLNPAPND